MLSIGEDLHAADKLGKGDEEDARRIGRVYYRAENRQKQSYSSLERKKTITSSWEELRSADEPARDELMALLLDLVLQEYINFRLFSDTNKIMEQYKFQRKTTLQKKESLRRDIQN